MIVKVQEKWDRCTNQDGVLGFFSGIGVFGNRARGQGSSRWIVLVLNLFYGINGLSNFCLQLFKKLWIVHQQGFYSISSLP